MLEAVSALILFASLLAGLVGLARPIWIGLQSRLAALAIVLFFPVGVAAIMEFVSEDESPEIEGGTLLLATIYALIMLALWQAKRVWRLEKRGGVGDRGIDTDVPKPSSVIPDRTPEEVDATYRTARSARLARERTRPAEPVKTPVPAIEFDAPGKPHHSEGTFVRFVYVDSNGEVTDREVRNWELSDYHLEGFCLLRKAKRTFRVDRVESWGDWA
ncbi:MAG: hypothetical protein MK010_00120 [Erythrobacter sp.]|nr:hypothetical protein [Erythrobacter sp.]